MEVLSISTQSIANKVWTNGAPRTITSLGAGVAGVSVQNSIVAASTTVNIRPTGSTVLIVAIMVRSSLTGSSNIFATDGLNQFNLATIGANSNGAGPMMVMTAQNYGQVINNDAVNNASYSYGAMLLTP